MAAAKRKVEAEFMQYNFLAESHSQNQPNKALELTEHPVEHPGRDGSY